jgi:hypothetical protein
MSLEEIGELTQPQINHILFHERDDNGAIKLRNKNRRGLRTKVEVFREYHLGLGYTNEEIDALLEQCQKEAIAAQRQVAGFPPTTNP